MGLVFLVSRTRLGFLDCIGTASHLSPQLCGCTGCPWDEWPVLARACMGEGACWALGVFDRGILETVAFEFSLKAVSTCLSQEIWIQEASGVESGNRFF